MDSTTLQHIISQLKAVGWVHKSLGAKRTNGKISPIQGFEAFIRRTKIDDFLKKSSFKESKKQPIIEEKRMGSKSPMGAQKVGLTPFEKSFDTLPLLAKQKAPRWSYFLTAFSAMSSRARLISVSSFESSSHSSAI